MLTSLFDFMKYDFGYPFYLTWSHATVFAIAGVAALLTWRRGWPVWTTVVPGLVSVWGLTGAIIMHGFGINSPVTLPTERFLPSGSGKVIDLGAGSGRASLGVLLARPRSTVMALDLYDGSYWGIEGNTPQRLHVNARVAGVDERIEARAGDMRTLPFTDGEFDAAISSFAIDHLRREGVAQALAEAARVLRPGGQFLLMVINVDLGIRIALPSIHGGYFSRPQDPERWRSALAAAGFDVVEVGTAPGTLYLLAQKPA